MILLINDVQEDLPVNTVKDLAECKRIARDSTAIALNGRLVKRDRWADTELHPMDSVTIISAAYGG